MTFLCFQDPSTWFPDVPGKAVGDLPGRTNGLRGEKQQETWIRRGNFPEIWMFSHGVKSHVTNVSEKNLEWVKHLLIKTGRPAETGGGLPQKKKKVCYQRPSPKWCKVRSHKAADFHASAGARDHSQRCNIYIHIHANMCLSSSFHQNEILERLLPFKGIFVQLGFRCGFSKCCRAACLEPVARVTT